MPTMMTAAAQSRFSKQSMLNHLEWQMIKLEKIWGFREGDGTNSVAHLTDEHKIAFGQYDAYRTLIDTIRYNDL